MRFSYRVYDLNTDHIFTFHEQRKKKEDRSAVAYEIYRKIKDFFEDHKDEFPQIIEVWKYNVSACGTKKLMCTANYDTEQEEGFSISFTNEFMKTFKNHPMQPPHRNGGKEYQQIFEDIFEEIDLAKMAYINEINKKQLECKDDAGLCS